MKLAKQRLILFGGTVLAGLFLITGSPAMGQAYDPTDWYGGYNGYLDDYDDVNDYFYDDTIYDPNDYGYDDDYYDRDYPNPRSNYDLSDDYDSRYFPGNDLGDAGYGYSRYRTFPGGPHFNGGSRYYGPHRQIDGYNGLYERPYGYNNYYYDDSKLGALGGNYFTNDWYDRNAGFDDWY